MQYHINTNDGHFDRMWELFTDDAYVDFGYISRARGREEIKALFLRIPRNLPLVKQFIHNHMVDVDGDEATGTSYLDARYAQDGESVMVAARFDEIYVRTEEGWRIKQMLLELYFSVPITVGWAGEQLNYVKPFT
jgi:ketosteroid isomerase-like protein